MTADNAGAPSGASDAASIEPLKGAYRSYAMTLLLALYIVNFLDRQVINILAEPIKRDLGLADWQLGVMTGLAFAGVYTVLGIPVARLAERANRPLIIGVAVTVWSAFTALCGFAQNFWQLVLARFGVGVGEAGATPPAHSLIIDYVPPEKRSSALAFYGMGAPIGGLIGMGFGGIIADAYGWRTAFLMAGAPGLVLALLALFTLNEPRKALRRHAETTAANAVSFWEAARHLLGKRSYRFLVSAMAVGSISNYGFTPFVASFYLRNHADAVASAGAVFGLQSIGFLGLAIGLLAGLCGATGMWSGGQLADRFAGHDPRRYMYGSAIAAALCVFAFVGLLFAPSIVLSLALFGLGHFFSSAWYGPAYTASFSMVPATMRATNTAMILFISNMVGLGLGPVVVGLFSDWLGAHLGPAEGVRWSLACLSSLTLLSAALFWAGARTLREDAAT
jgi:MFS family permease